MPKVNRQVISTLLAFWMCHLAAASEPYTLANVPDPVPLSADEPFAKQFSLAKATEAFDISALDWQKTYSCAACHTLPPYLMTRPHLRSIAPEPPEVRQFFETIVERRLEPEPALPFDGISAITIQVATALAFHDRATTGKLHLRTRGELDRMWTRQRDDGSWDWPFRDTPPFKCDEHYGVTIAALGASVAPDNYAQPETARIGLMKIRRYLKATPVTSLHQDAMMLWLSSRMSEILEPSDPPRIVAQLFAAQRPDGGWSMASLIDNIRDPARQTDEGRAARGKAGYGNDLLIFVGRDKVYHSSLASDAYATGFVIYVLRQAQVSAKDERIQRGVVWLKTHQRESGRWFTPSQGWHTEHRIANTGTAYALLALHACGEIP